jgi:hypothetical protein
MIIFAGSDDDVCFEPKESTMQEVASQQGWSDRPNEVDRDARLMQAIDSLRSENNQLKSLVVRLSETIIRNVNANGKRP